MSPYAQPYRAPAPNAAGVVPAPRVTRVQVALVTAASLGALVLLAPRAVPPPPPPVEAATPPLTTLPLPPVLRAETRPAIPTRPPPSASSQAGAAMEQALGCLRAGGSDASVNRCIVNALQGRATTEPEQRLLCITLRQMGDRARAVACMRQYLQRHPDTRYSAQFLEYVLDG